jgi:hypothetical protein
MTGESSEVSKCQGKLIKKSRYLFIIINGVMVNLRQDCLLDQKWVTVKVVVIVNSSGRGRNP